MELEFTATVIYWRGPAPYFYARIPDGPGGEISRIRKAVTYGWGVIPVEATIGAVRFTTSLFPRDGTYVLPLKASVRQRLGVTVDDEVAVTMVVGRAPREPDL